MQATQLNVGDYYFQAQILRYGESVDNGSGDKFTTFEEAEADGQVMAWGYDPEFTKRNPDVISYAVGKWIVKALDNDGSVGIAESVNF